MQSNRIKHLAWEQGHAFYIRRIPNDLRFLYSSDGSKWRIRKSLKTTDPKTAALARDRYHVQIEDEWAMLRAKACALSDKERFDLTMEYAAKMGFPHMPIEQLARGPVNDLHARLSYVTEQSEALTSGVSQARAEIVLCTQELPALDLESFFDEVLELYDDKLVHKSKEQVRVWSQARKRAINNLITVVGNKPFGEVTRDDARRFKSWWWDRVKAGEAKAGTANKDFEYLRAMFGKVIKARQLEDDMKNVWSNIVLEVETKPKRPSLTREEAISSIFAGNPLWSMDPDCRAIVEICAELGTRPKEIMTREPEDIVLDAAIPHVIIRPNKFGKLKTLDSERILPLVGAALKAFKRHPQGFPKYAERTSSAITAINKYFRDNKIMPRGRTLYSLRHAFEDRLLVLGTQEKVKKILMGHSRGPIDYGDGPPLEHKLKILEQIALYP